MSRKLQNTATSNNRALRVYIGGLSSSNEAEGLTRFFSRFGDIDNIQYFSKTADRQSSNNNNTCNNRKSYYILTTRSEDAFKRIIDSQDIVYNKRKLFCLKYMTGPELASHNQDRNQRRFLVKHVPQELTENDLFMLLENHVGEVELIYKLESTHESSKEPASKFRTFGLLLRNSQVARILPKVLSVAVASSHSQITVQRFFHNKEEQSHSSSKNVFHPSKRSKKNVLRCQKTQESSTDSTPLTPQLSLKQLGDLIRLKPTSSQYSLLRNSTQRKSSNQHYLDNNHHTANLRCNVCK